MEVKEVTRLLPHNNISGDTERNNNFYYDYY